MTKEECQILEEETVPKVVEINKDAIMYLSRILYSLEKRVKFLEKE